MQATEDLIRNVVQEVLARMGTPAAPSSSRGFQGRHGIFTCVNEAVAAATEAFEQLSERTIEERKRIIDHIRRISIDDCVELGTMEMQETKIGRLEHKIAKLKTLGERTPGVFSPSVRSFSILCSSRPILVSCISNVPSSTDCSIEIRRT